ncbi:hypothetical protein PRIC1_014473 [Phytophthora ramorum]|uniref:Glycoside hydrolase 131 catalytic N-terminal domain-containing protein n=1 Tax=Phytophthora ramorum TaxID=164328 RepID=H3H1F1_PHYRM|nr:hypothetical protein KRP23_8295 [Phytophthora ramorum]
MQISAVLLGLVSLSSSVVSTLAAPSESLPWDGRAKDLTVDKLEDKYVTKVLTQRNGKANGAPADYVTITADGRSPAYNGDSGVIDIGVDDKAVWSSETYSRRSELVQNITTNATGTTFFRASVLKNDTFFYPYGWKLIFPDSQLFEIRVDATSDLPKILYMTNGTKGAQWTSRFKLDTWYNFGVGVKPASTGKGTELQFYTSTGDADLALNITTEIAVEFPSTVEMHYGLLTQSKSKTGPMLSKKQEIMSFNGVSAESEVVTTATVDTAQTASSVAGEAEEVHQTGKKTFTF